MAKKVNQNTGRNWATLVYPESAVDGWQKILKDAHVPCYVSPLHKDDVDDDGNPKKEHYHVLFAFKGNKSRASVEPIVKDIGGVGLERVSDLHAYARYLCHLDEYKKTKYSMSDVVCIGGVDYKKFRTQKKDMTESIMDVVNLIVSEEITSYSTLLVFCTRERPELVNLVFQNAYAVQCFIASNSADIKSEEVCL